MSMKGRNVVNCLARYYGDLECGGGTGLVGLARHSDGGLSEKHFRKGNHSGERYA